VPGSLYFDLILHSLSEVARQALQKMDPAKYEYQSEFAKRYFGEGRLEGREEGRKEGREQARVELVLQLLTLRFGALPDSLRAQVSRASSAELDQIAERLLTAGSLVEAVRPTL
jgi:predicted transposase YdaD